MKKNIIIVILLLIIVGFLASKFKWNIQEDGSTNKACTLEAKMCPDGTSVGRTGPNCEFAACPETGVTTTSKVQQENSKIEGRRLVYFRSVEKDDMSAMAKVDPIEMFNGEEATKAAMEDTKCSREKVTSCAGSLNNNFYIRNLSTQTQSVVVTLSTDIYLQSSTNPAETEKVGILGLKEIAKNWSAERFATTPFWVTVSKGKVTKMEQQYLP